MSGREFSSQFQDGSQLGAPAQPSVAAHPGSQLAIQGEPAAATMRSTVEADGDLDPDSYAAIAE